MRRQAFAVRGAHAEDAQQALREELVDGDLRLARRAKPRGLPLQLCDQLPLHPLRMPDLLGDLAAADGAAQQDQRLRACVRTGDLLRERERFSRGRRRRRMSAERGCAGQRP